MKTEELLLALKEGANFEMTKENFGYSGWGNILNFPECKEMSRSEYNYHYEKKKKLLESLPWTKVVENPRNPKEGEYPTEDGEYITMLDCNEHEVLTNRFRDGSWLLYHKTHIKWWMLNPLWENKK